MCKIVYFPDYSSGNPYQKLLYSNFDVTEFEVVPNTLDYALDELLKGEKVIFHIHWLNFLFKSCTTIDEAWHVVNMFILKLDNFTRYGGFIVWTVHNLLSHEIAFYEPEVRLRHYLSCMSAIIHLHCASHAELISNFCNIDYSKIVIDRHGGYFNCYGRICYRDKLLHLHEKSVTFVGALRRYKNIDILVKILNIFHEHGFSVTIAGRPEDSGIANLINSSLSDGIQKILRRLNASELHSLLLKNNLGILSYDRILTSGTLKLYCTYGMNVFCPVNSVLKCEDRYGSFFWYDSDNLMQSIVYFLDSSADSIEHRAVLNLLSVKEIYWGGNLLKAVRKLVC